MRRNVALFTFLAITLISLTLSGVKNTKRKVHPPSETENPVATKPSGDDQSGAEFYGLKSIKFESCEIDNDKKIEIKIQILKIAISPTLCHATILDIDSKLTLWDLKTAQAITSVKTFPSEILFSDNGQYLMTNSAVYRISTGEAVLSVKGSERIVSFENGESAISVSNDDDDLFSVRQYELTSDGVTVKRVNSPIEANENESPRLLAAPLPNGEILLAFAQGSDVVMQRLNLSEEKAHSESATWYRTLGSIFETFATPEE